MTEEEMRQALFGTAGPTVHSTAQQIKPNVIDVAPSPVASKRKEAKSFAPKMRVTLRVGNEYEGTTELFTFESGTLSTLQAELNATKMARQKYRFVEVVSVKSAK
ncbi:hypothetical protein D3C85_1034520 [compost metagenome]